MWLRWSNVAHGRAHIKGVFENMSRGMTNQQSVCAPSEDSDQPGHSPSLIRVFAVRMKKP